MSPDPDRLLGTAEAADILGWPRRKVQRALVRAAATGEIPIIRIGARDAYIIHESDLDTLREADQKTS